VGGGVKTGSTRHRGHLLAYRTCPGWLWGWRIWWNEWQGKPKYSEKSCPGATLSTTNPTWPDPGLNAGRRGGKPATNRFSYGAAVFLALGYTLTPNYTYIQQYSAIADLHHLQHTVAHTLGLPVSTGRLLATAFNTGIITVWQFKYHT
jgi:hypothetical protein